MNPNIVTRLYQPETDSASLTALVNTVQGTSLTHEQVEAQMAWTGHQPEKDRIVAVLDNQLIGLGVLLSQSKQRSFLDVRVHPDHRRQGIGRALLDRLVEEARRRGAQQATGAAEAHNQPAQQFARVCGFAPAGEVRFFSAPAELSLPEPALPAGFQLRTGEALADVQLYVDACNRCYKDMWGHHENLEPITVERIEQWRKRHPQWFALDHLFVIFAPDGNPVGVTRVLQEGEGDAAVRVIDAPGTAPEYRHLGLQRTLVAAGAGWLKHNAAGRYEIQTWGDFPEAVQIYEALGFTFDEAQHSIEFVKYL